MTALTAFLPYVTPFAQAVYEPQALAAVRDSAIEFCRTSELLRADLDPFKAVPEQLMYEIDSPVSGTMLLRVIELKLDNGPAPLYYHTVPTVLMLERPVGAGTFTGKVAYAPTRTATTVDDILFSDYVEDIAAGALARVLLTAGQPYYDPPRAAGYLSRFTNGKNKARMRANALMVGVVQTMQQKYQYRRS